MIACASAKKNASVSGPPEVTFESVLPAIRRHVAYAFRHVRRSLREELAAEAIARSYVAYVRLVNRGLAALVYASALSKYAIRQVWDGRRIGSRRNTQDVLSERAQARHAFVVERLADRNANPRWEEQLLTSRRTTPAELVACKLDFQSWLQQLSRFKRRVALRLAAGDTTGEAAARFRLSLSRVSQIRRELQMDWNTFQAQPTAA